VRVAVVGGTGDIGSAVVRELLDGGQEIIVLSRNAPAHPLAGGAEHRAIDLSDGKGLSGALRGVDVVVDASDGPANKAAKTLVDGTHRLLEAERAESVRHHLTISIVGCERMPTAYYRVKAAQERVVAAAPNGWTIVRATQLHGLLDFVFAKTARYGLLPAPRGTLQPVDRRTLAHVVAHVAAGAPLRDRIEVAGPEIGDIGEFARTWREHRGSRARIVRVPLKPSVGRALRSGALTNPAVEHAGALTFAQWLASAR
jgi:uncharacterized protein YbjT (DUF2867 family)